MSKWLRRGGLVAITLLVAVALAYPAVDLFKKQLNDESRAELKQTGEAHSFIELDDGVTHYRLEGAPTKGTIVLLHGVLNSSQIYEAYFAPLTGAGYRVLSYDLYGRGYSDRPSVPYTAELFDRQLLELLDKLGITGRIHLGGFTIGAPIGAIFSERHPDRVASLTLMAAAGLLEKHEVGRQAMPVIGDWIYHVLGPWQLESYVLHNARSLPDPMSHLRDYRKWSIYSGHEDAVLSTLRNFPYYATREHYAAVAKLGLPVFAIWGAADDTYPVSQLDILKQLVPQAIVNIVAGAGHALVYAEPDVVSKILVSDLANVPG